VADVAYGYIFGLQQLELEQDDLGGALDWFLIGFSAEPPWQDTDR
jgi:hypothetical protein